MRHKWLFQLIGVLIFAFILYKVNIKAVIHLFRDAHFTVLLLALIITVPFIILKAVRWRYLLAMQGIEYGAKDSMLAYLGSMYMGLVTPGRLGDFIKVIYLKTDMGVTLGKGFSSVITDRLFDLLILISMAISGVLAFALSRNMLIIVLAWLFIYLLIVLVFFNERIGKKAMGILFRIFMPRRKGGDFELQFRDFYLGMKEFKRIELIIPLLLSLLTYSILYVQCYMIAYSLNISISLLNIAFCISTANLISLLPISISGIGTRDATMIAMFSMLQLSRESALSFSIMFLFISNISACAVGALAWFRKPVQVKA
jgi:uncharacterized protein (TIRG00374 family)